MLSAHCPFQAIRLLSQLSARLPDMVHLLQPNFDDTAAIITRQGFAQVTRGFTAGEGALLWGAGC